MAEHGRAIVNASPLISLGRSGHLDLLRHFAAAVTVPSEVVEELAQGGGRDDVAHVVAAASWVQVLPPVAVPAALRAHPALGRGETAVIANALLDPSAVAVLDDRAARRAALAMNLRVGGTLAVIAIAMRDGVIRAARPVVHAVLAAGSYVSPRVAAEFLAALGE